MEPTDVPNPSQHNQWYPFLDRPLPREVDGVMQNSAIIPISGADPLPASARFVVVGAGIHGMSKISPPLPPRVLPGPCLLKVGGGP